jgi:hypothetical protein
MNNKNNSFGPFLTGILAATAVIGYFLFGSKHARRNRDKVEQWVEDATDEVLTEVKKAKRMSRQKYDDIVDTVMQKYEKLKEVGSDKANSLRNELKRKMDEAAQETDMEMDEE